MCCKHCSACLQVGPECRAEVAAFAATNFNLDASSASAELLDVCHDDAVAVCEYSAPLAGQAAGSHVPRHVLACLRENNPQLASTACAQRVMDEQLAATHDYTSDWPLYDACRGDAERLCRPAHGDGVKVLVCLRSKKGQVCGCSRINCARVSSAACGRCKAPRLRSRDSAVEALGCEVRAACYVQVHPPCKRELFRSDVEAAGDLRLQRSLHRACTAELAAFCADAPFSEGRAQLCLERHRFAPRFRAACRVPLEARMAEQARDWRLDAPLRSACRDDVLSYCQFERDTAGISPSTGAHTHHLTAQARAHCGAGIEAHDSKRNCGLMSAPLAGLRGKTICHS